jgi:hypothetical protein
MRQQKYSIAENKKFSETQSVFEPHFSGEK